MSKKNTDLQNKIEDKFNKLMIKTETDPQLKKEVFSTIAKIEAAATITDLFTIKLIKTEVSIISNFDEDQHLKENK